MSAVAELRRFDRAWCSTVRLLAAGARRTGCTLAEARLVVELAQGTIADLATLRAALGLDAGSLTRTVSRLTRRGLVSTARSTGDRRRQTAELTPAGRALAAELAAAASAEATALLSRLPSDDLEAVVAAMVTLRTALEPRAGRRTVTLRGPDPGDLGWVVERHGAVYAAEYGWDRTFEALVAGIVGDVGSRREDPREAVWIAEVDGRRAGGVFCVRRDEDTAQLRLLLVEPWARGLGVGATLVARCIEFARAAGYRTMVLWTNDVLVAARRIYEAAGFELVEEEPHHSFGHDLVGQTWLLPLGATDAPASSLPAGERAAPPPGRVRTGRRHDGA